MKTKVKDGDVTNYRVCPECGRKNWTKSVTYARVTTNKFGIRKVKMMKTDAVNFTCHHCGIEECS